MLRIMGSQIVRWNCHFCMLCSEKQIRLYMRAARMHMQKRLLAVVGQADKVGIQRAG